MSKVKTMRDALISGIYERMAVDERLYFLSADFGAPMLDNLRAKYSKRFVNVGIAEQNLIGISAGLATEGYIPFAYAIAPFITMRAYEQRRNNLSLLSHHRQLNVNLVGVGAGVSYDVSGPTHHCLEDLIVMRTLPNIYICSPSDWVIASKFLDYAIEIPCPKYIRLDSKPIAALYDENSEIDFRKGFHVFSRGKELCLITTGFITHTAKQVVKRLSEEGKNIGLIDVFMLRPLNSQALINELREYKHIITAEEGFIDKGGLDSLISSILLTAGVNVRFGRMGFGDSFVFNLGDRKHLHAINGLDEESMIKKVYEALS